MKIDSPHHACEMGAYFFRIGESHIMNLKYSFLMFFDRAS